MHWVARELQQPNTNQGIRPNSIQNPTALLRNCLTRTKEADHKQFRTVRMISKNVGITGRHTSIVADMSKSVGI
ncbi:hypothetical protein TWF970_005585 [Orbilia oligospora]|uniref:Uncharacterized protein n=1 Tax=Orbilia oligospora TaxID=2813651 RepID=A0A7C8VMH3_ORBOL|nr:hypothetical protein TWF970_005585 [Orbilia oligospora]